MFENCGGKVKILAKVVFVLSFVAAIVVFLAPFMDDVTWGLWWLGLLGAIGILISGYISALVLYTIGDTWESANSALLLYGTVGGKKPNYDPIDAERSGANQSYLGPIGGWQCSCGHINNGTKASCSRCGKERPKPAAEQNVTVVNAYEKPKEVMPVIKRINSNITVLEDGKWKCSCGHINNMAKADCARCGMSKEV